MIRVLDGKNYGERQDYKSYVGNEYDDFEDFVNSLSHSFYVIEVGAVSDDKTMGYVYLEGRFNYTEKCTLWFEDVNIINPRKYQKYL